MASKKAVKTTLKITPGIIYETITDLFDDSYIMFGDTPVPVMVDLFSLFHKDPEKAHDGISWGGLEDSAIDDFFKQKYINWAKRGSQYRDVYGIRFVSTNRDPDFFHVELVINGYHTPKTGVIVVNERG